MTAVISNNVIQIRTSDTSLVNSAKKPEAEYPKVCDFCRDTYNSELTYKRHKETGKCYRFCKLREIERRSAVKARKTSIYPRVCNACLKVYKNKHSYYKHKTRCRGKSDDAPSESPTLPVSSIVDVVEVVRDDIENIPITDNKENIDDFDSNFILTLDVAIDKDFDSSDSLYPRICEICHKVFKTHESFELHKIQTKCSGVKMNPPVEKTRVTSSHLSRCENCYKLLPKQLYSRHIKRCGKLNLATVSVLKKVDDFISDAGNTDELESESAPGPSPSEVRPPKEFLFNRYCHGCDTKFTSKTMYYRHKCSRRTPRQSIYPRVCNDCGRLFRSKFTFHRHKEKCKQYSSDLLDEDDLFVSCNICFRPFDTIPIYLQHMKHAHPDAKLEEMPYKRKHMYPRKCSKCFIVYSTRQTFCNHKKKCAATSEPLFVDLVDVPDTPEQEENIEKVVYPRTCTECQHTYLNRQSFCNHKKLCQNFVATVKDVKLYPRRCEFCLKVYATKQTYHHHKSRCHGFDKSTSASLYPRTCNHCNRTYAIKQSYNNHLITCPGGQNTLVVEEEENVSSEDNLDRDDIDYEPEVKRQRPTHTMLYPRICELCRKIYANRVTFNKHKARCVSAQRPLNVTVEECNASTLLPEPEPVVYPRECENCLGTFKSEGTFNAHKIRCDFFETKVDESQFKTYLKSNCEHCRNIVSQYRRIFHQHLEQCSDPIIVNADILLEAEPTTTENPPLHNEVTPNSSDANNFCDCCGMFFKTRAQIEQHKKKLLRSSENSSLLECDICTEVLDSQEELTDHKSRCVLNVGNRTYPRFCECCKKIYKNKQTFYNHKKNCHVHCLKYFVFKDCENCKLPFKCEELYLEHAQKCVRISDEAVAAECEISDKPVS